MWRNRGHKPIIGAVAALVVIFGLYLLTLSPDVLPGDSGEFQALIPIGGVLHPSGFPLYQLLGRAEIFLLPVGTVAWRVNLLSALFATAAAGAAMLVLKECGISNILAILGGAALALMPVLWRYAVIAEVYALAVLLLFPLWLLGCRLYDRGRGFLWLAFFSGLALSHYLAFAAALPWPFLAWLRAKDEWRLKRVILGVILFLAPFSLYALIALQARRWMQAFPGEMFGFPEAVVRGYVSPFWLAGFVKYVTAYTYTAPSSPLWELSNIDFGAIVRVWTSWMLAQFSILGVLLALAGVAWFFRRRPFFLVMTVPPFLFTAFLSARYALVYQEEMGFYFIAFMALGVWAVAGVQALYERLKGRMRILPILLIAALIGWEIFTFQQQPTYWAEQLGDNSLPRAWATAALTEAEPDSVIFGDWGLITPLRYLQFAEHTRPDVAVVHAPLGDEAFMARLIAETRASGKKAYVLLPDPALGAVLTPAP